MESASLETPADDYFSFLQLLWLFLKRCCILIERIEPKPEESMVQIK